MGIGSKLNLLFIDPWDPLNSLIMSVTITMLLVYKSIAFRYNTVNPNSIIYYTPINSIGKSLLIGILVNMFINNLYFFLSTVECQS